MSELPDNVTHAELRFTKHAVEKDTDRLERELKRPETARKVGHQAVIPFPYRNPTMDPATIMTPEMYDQMFDHLLDGAKPRE